MSFKFVIHPAAHLLLLILEVFGMNLAVEIFTQHLPDKKRFVKGSLLTAIAIFILDLFIFDFYKSLFRTIVLLIVMFFNFKYVGKLSVKKSGIQTGVVVLLMFIIEVFMFILIKMIFPDSISMLFDNFGFVYALYLCLFYLLVIIGSTFNLSIVKLNK